MKPGHYRVHADRSLRLSDFDASEHGHLDREQAEARTAALLEQMASWQTRLYAEGRQSLLIVLQARDAGGKDGTVRHVFSGLNPQGVSVTSFKVPTPQEAAHDFLWRVHAHTPAAGCIAIFNRSHYEDVLVTQVHGQLKRREAKSRLEQICQFEALLGSRGTRVLKFYLHISPEEQLARFRERLDDPDKRWKFNEGDLTERAYWKAYTKAYQEALAGTSTSAAPWYVVPADHKWFRNLLISEVILETLKDMNPQYPKVELDIEALLDQMDK